jgi:prepilin-type N-terminal cleavage/methylation domain-containing protein
MTPKGDLYMFMLGDRLRQRLHREEGFTLIELLVVMAIIGILLAIAIPSYLGFTNQANQRDAQANLREAVPSVEAFYSDNNTYNGMTFAALQGYDSGLSADVVVGPAAQQTATAFCIQAAHGGFTYHLNGPGGTIPVAPNGPC